MVVELPTQRSVAVHDLAKLTILFYGLPGIGKSTIASKFPKPLFFESEPGLNQLEVHKVPTYTWEDFKSTAALVARGEHDFATSVVDTADNAFDLCVDWVCRENKVPCLADLGYGKGFKLADQEWRRVLTKLASLSGGLILISHAITKQIQTRTEEAFSKTQSTLPDRARQPVLGMADMILFCDIEATTDKQGNTIMNRVMRTQPCLAYEAKDRTGKLPAVLPLDYDAFYKAFTATGEPTK